MIRAVVWRGAYELAVLLVVAVVLMVPVHRAFVRHVDVARTLPDGRVELAADLPPGEVLTLWRFHDRWQVPLGEVRVEEVGASGAVATYDPAALRWPMGRHGRVIAQEGRLLTLDVGRELGFAPGDRVTLFDGRRPVGAMRLEEVGLGRSKGRGGPPSAVGLGASEYTVRTQVTIGADDPRATALQAALLAALVGAWLGVVVGLRRWPLEVLGAALRRVPVPRRLGWALEIAAIGAIGGLLVPTVSALVVDRAAAWLALDPPGASRLVRPWLDWTVGAGVAAAGAVSLVTGERPMVALRRALWWDRSLVARLPPQGRPLALWTLHLVVAWAFAKTLWGFLKANLREALALGWPEAPRDPGLLEALAWPLTHLPSFPSASAAFEVAKYALWSLTILGCLLGYGHSVLAPLWGGNKIRSLDFTVPGWVTSALCYPLLGPALWQLLPSRPGPDPLVTGGLVATVAMVTGLWLNLLYTASIWSMGTRFGVMVDKGLVDRAFHGVVRHPSYTLEAAMFVVLDLVGLTTWREWLSVSSWFLLYWMRSEREDDYMAASNPDYPDYQRRVRWKFLPGIW